MQVQKEKLADMGASLIIWLVMTLLLWWLTNDNWFWWFIKSGMTLMFIYGVRRFFVELTLLRYQELDKGKD